MINPQEYLDKKIEKLYTYFTENNISGVVLGISGGVDSAVTLGIFKAFQIKYPDVLKIIRPVIAPIHNSIGTTEQLEAQGLGELVCKHFSINASIIHLSNMSIACKTSLTTANPIVVQQCDYWLRPTAFYGVATTLSQTHPKLGHIVLSSTCNYSEWMSGYFSSYLDILALNPIIDLWKSEVYQLAKYFNIPVQILTTSPKGGLANGNTDEQELGFTYQQLEFHFEYNGDYYTQNVQDAFNKSRFKRSKFNPNWIEALSVI